jgi:Leucine-rich repeat (LRR) protein
LRLEALEILDLSRNRIKVLPEEIGNLKALKVLAISRNRIQRLPLSLGDLPRLQLLKFDENPLIFPPPEAYALTGNTLNSAKSVSTNEQESLMTIEIKKHLLKTKKGTKNLFGDAKAQAKDQPYSERDAT